MIISCGPFKGLAPMLTPTMLPEQNAQTALNCLFNSGALRPLATDGSVTVNETLVAGTKKSIYKYDDLYWLAWLLDVNVCRSTLPLDAFKRLYWTGDGAPKMGDVTAILSGTSKPGSSYTLGIPKPAAAITAASESAPLGTVNDETRAYVYTYVSIFGEEGPPSTPSAIVTIPPGGHVNISGMSVGGANIASKNIYRVNTGSTTSSYQYVGSVLNAVTTFHDDVADDALGEILLSEEWIAAPASMIGLISHPAGFLAGFYDNILCLSVIGLPHAWPASYQIAVDAPIVAIGAYGNSILVTTTGLPYVVTGTTPGQMTIEKLEKGEPCILKRGLVDMGYACIYPGVSGLWVAGTGAVELATQQLMTKTEWSAYSATLQFAVQYEHLYIGFMTTGGFIFDTLTNDFIAHDVTATGGWYDRANGKLYLIVNGSIVSWRAGNSTRSLTWKSKKFRAPQPMTMAAGQIFASGAVTLKVYADGVLKHTETQVSASSTPFRLPSGFRATDWELQIEASCEVAKVVLASTMSELATV